MPLKCGLLGGANLVAGKEEKIYGLEAPALAATVTVSFCNKGPTDVIVRLAIGPGADSTAEGTLHLEFNAVVVSGTPLERTGIVISGPRGHNVFAWSDTSLVDVAVYGYEKGDNNGA